MLQTTAVYLTEEEAKRFVVFQKHFSFVQALSDLGAFEMRAGSVEIHFVHASIYARIGLQKFSDTKAKIVGVGELEGIQTGRSF